MKKEIPILFSTDMVKANMERRKTNTRRTKGLKEVNKDPDKVTFLWFQEYPDGSYRAIFQHDDSDDAGSVKCPYGKPGDVLYVRESWKITGFWMEEAEVRISYADGNDMIVGYDFDQQDWVVKQWEKLVDKGIIVPSKDPEDGEYERMEFAEGVKHPFSPSIHLPKWAARIWLEVVDVRVERLQDISYDDAIAEGIDRWTEERMRSKPTHYAVYYNEPGDDSTYSSCPIISFQTLWQKINGPESWEANPWVWVIKYKVLSTTGRPEGI